MHELTLLVNIWFGVFVAAMVNLEILPEEMPVFIVDFSEFGIILIMLALGFVEDTRHCINDINRS